MFGRAFAKAHQIAAQHATRLEALGRDKGVHAVKKDSKGELYIYEEIGVDFWTGGGVTGKSVVDELAKLKGVSQLDVRINSPGGDVFEGKAIYNALKRFAATKTVYVDGIAASAASFIAMAGDKIVTAENATWMIHEAGWMAFGHAADLRAAADVLDMENVAIAGIYAARTGQPASMFWARSAPSAADSSPKASGLMAEDTWMSAQDALAANLTDEIEKNVTAEPDEDAALAAKVPAFRIAAETQRRIAAARKPALVLADMEQSLLNDRRAVASRRH